MRRFVVAVAAAVMLATGCQPAPTVTITSKIDTDFPICGIPANIIGKVTPAAATPKVVLQHTVAGKWVDVKGSADADSYSEPHTLRTANVSKTTGDYSIPYYVDWIGTKHLRVRSYGGGATSPGFYVKVTAFSGC